MTHFFDVCLAEQASPAQLAEVGARAALDEPTQTLVRLPCGTEDGILPLLRRAHDLGLEIGDLYCETVAPTGRGTNPGSAGGQDDRRRPSPQRNCILFIGCRLGPMFRSLLREERATSIRPRTRLLLPSDRDGQLPVGRLQRLAELGLNVVAAREIRSELVLASGRGA